MVVYDAITFDRVYHKGMLAPAAMRKLLEWSRMHFNPDGVHIFIKAVGIYPTGSLVMLESGRLAVVVDQSDGSLLQPRVRVVYDTHKTSFMQACDVNWRRPPVRAAPTAYPAMNCWESGLATL